MTQHGDVSDHPQVPLLLASLCAIRSEIQAASDSADENDDDINNNWRRLILEDEQSQDGTRLV